MEGGAKENKTNLERGPGFFYAGNPLDNETWGAILIYYKTLSARILSSNLLPKH